MKGLQHNIVLGEKQKNPELTSEAKSKSTFGTA